MASIPTAGSRIAEFARTELGLPLWPGQQEVLDSFEAGVYSSLILQCGRRSGKSTLSDVIALFDACVRDLGQFVRVGEERVCAIIAPRQQQAEAHIRRCGQLVRQSKRLRPLLISETSDSLHFSTGAVIRAYPASSRGLRGDAWSSCVLDELAYFLDGEGNAAGDEIVQAARPALAQFHEDGWLIALSTPGSFRRGAFFELTQQAQSGRYPHMLFIQKATVDMNPKIKQEFLESRQSENLDSYRQEYLAEWVDSGSTYLRSEDVLACVQKGRTILRPQEGTRYTASIDPAFTADNFSLAIGHRQGTQAIIDGVWVWNRKGYENTLSEVVALLKQYGCQEVRTDQHAAQPIREGLDRRGIYAVYEPWTQETKSAAYTRLKVALNSRLVELPDDKELVSELCSLQVKPTATSFPRIAAAGAGKDDRAIVVASVVHALEKSSEIFGMIANFNDGSTTGFGPGGEWRDPTQDERAWEHDTVYIR